MNTFFNPIRWLQFAFEVLWSVASAIWQGLLSFLGIHPRPPRGQHNDIQPVDVEQAGLTEAERQAKFDTASAAMEPADIVFHYARASTTDRPAINLAALSQDQQHWLLNLSDGDLVLLSASGRSSCARSLEHRMVIPNLAKLRPRRMHEVIAEPPPLSKEDIIRARYSDVVRNLNGRSRALA